jgi:hypothetical protein
LPVSRRTVQFPDAASGSNSERRFHLLWFQSREGTYQGRPVEYSPLNGLSKLRDRGSPVAKRIYDLVAKTDAFEQLY